MRSYKFKLEQLQKGLELAERMVEHEKAFNSKLNNNVQKRIDCDLLAQVLTIHFSIT